MSAAEAYSGGEGFVATETRAERRERKIVDRIAARVVAAADEGKSYLEVRAGRLGIFETTHEPEVYAKVAERLDERENPIEITADRFTEVRQAPVSLEHPMLLGPPSMHAYDVVNIRSIGGTALEAEPYHNRGAEQQIQLYP